MDRIAHPVSMRLHSRRNQILQGGQRRGACRLSPGLHRISQKLLQGVAHKTYVDLVLLVSPESDNVHESLPPTGIRNDHLSTSMTQYDWDIMTGATLL
jgi:hypothetical protein